MAKYLAYRDGNKTDEVGFYRLLSNLFTGEVVQGLQVTQDSPLAMSVEVTSGDAMIDKGTGYKYHGWSDATETVTITTSNPSLDRIDVIVAYVDLSVSDAVNANSPGAFDIVSVDGTAAASPVAPNDATIQTAIGAGNPYIILAEVSVQAAATTIGTADITDSRNIIRPLTLNVLGQELMQPVAFSASATTGTSTTGTTFNKITLDSTIYNYGSSWNETSDKFIAPYKGVYHFDCVGGQGSANIIIVALYKNGTEIARGTDYRVSGNSFTSVLSCYLELNANDEIEFYLYVGNSGTSYSDEARCKFSGSLVGRIV